MKPTSKNLFLAAALAATVSSALAVDKLSTGTNLADPASWTGGVAPAADATPSDATAPTAAQTANWINTSNTGALTVDSAVNWGALNFSATTAAPVSISGSDITLSGSGQFTNHLNNASAQNVSIANNIIGLQDVGALTPGVSPTNPGRLTFAVNGTGNLSLSGNVTQTTGAGSSLFLRGAGTGLGTISGNINVNGILSKVDTSTWVLTGTNTIGFTGISGGVLRVGSAGALGSGAVYFNAAAGATGTLASDGATARSYSNALDLTTLNATGAAGFGDAVGTGALTFSGTVNLGTAARRITTNADTTFSGIVSGVGGGITKLGAGTLTLTNNANTYTGVTSFDAGTLAAGGNNSFGTSALRFGGGTLVSSDATDRSFANNLDIAVSSTLGSAGTGKLTFTGTNSGASVFGGGAKTLTVNGVVEFSGVLNGTAGSTNAITKAGTGTLIFSGANTYDRGVGATSGTLVNAGTLLANNSTGSATGVGSVTVATGATLGGTGFISGPTTVNGVLQGGAGAVGQTLTFSGAVILADNSIVQLALAGGLAHSTLALNSSESFDSNQAFTFLDLGATTGTYEDILTGIAVDPTTTANWTITNAGWTGNFVYDATNQSIDLVVTAVPEPGVALLGGLGVLALLRRRRA